MIIAGNMMNCRSSHQEVFHKKGAIKNFAKLTGKHRLSQGLLFNKVKKDFIKKDSETGVFP